MVPKMAIYFNEVEWTEIHRALHGFPAQTEFARGVRRRILEEITGDWQHLFTGPGLPEYDAQTGDPAGLYRLMTRMYRVDPSALQALADASPLTLKGSLRHIRGGALGAVAV